MKINPLNLRHQLLRCPKVAYFPTLWGDLPPDIDSLPLLPTYDTNSCGSRNSLRLGTQFFPQVIYNIKRVFQQFNRNNVVSVRNMVVSLAWAQKFFFAFTYVPSQAQKKPRGADLRFPKFCRALERHQNFDRCAISPSLHPPLAAVRLNAVNSRVHLYSYGGTSQKSYFKSKKKTTTDW